MHQAKGKGKWSGQGPPRPVADAHAVPFVDLSNSTEAAAPPQAPLAMVLEMFSGLLNGMNQQNMNVVRTMTEANRQTMMLITNAIARERAPDTPAPLARPPMPVLRPPPAFPRPAKNRIYIIARDVN